ncbi:MAG: hypothetical protein WAU00_10015 [Caldilinea sp.]
MEQESHPYQHFADRSIIDWNLIPLYALPPAAYRRIVNDPVNLVTAVLGDVQARSEPSLAQAVAAEAGTILMGYGEDVSARAISHLSR